MKFLVVTGIRAAVAPWGSSAGAQSPTVDELVSESTTSARNMLDLFSRATHGQFHRFEVETQETIQP